MEAGLHISPSLEMLTDESAQSAGVYVGNVFYECIRKSM